MNIITGKHGNVMVGETVVAEITRWKLLTTARVVTYSSSATGGASRRLVTMRSAAGDLWFQTCRDNPQHGQLTEGATVSLRLIVEPNIEWQGPVVIERLELDVDVSHSEGVAGQAKFVSDGAWTPP